MVWTKWGPDHIPWEVFQHNIPWEVTQLEVIGSGAHHTYDHILHMIRGYFNRFIVVLCIISIVFILYFLLRKQREKIKKSLRSLLFIGFFWLIFSIIFFIINLFFMANHGTHAAKPNIYFYPSQTTEITVDLPKTKLTVTYPEYDSWRKIMAHPDWTLVNTADNQEYSYIFREGVIEKDFDMNEWYVVKWSDTAKFLQEKLSYLWLTPVEYNEMIVFWLPKMLENPYNIIHFATKSEYDDKNPLSISPQPDSIWRVFMVRKSSEKSITIKEQWLTPIKREWFTVIERWGSQLK